MTGNLFELSFDAVVDGARALEVLAGSYLGANPPHPDTVHWHSQIERQEASERLRSPQSSLRFKRDGHFLHGRRLAELALLSRRSEDVHDALLNLFYGGLMIGRTRHFSAAARHAGFQFANLCAADMRVPRKSRSEVRERLEELSRSKDVSSFSPVFGLDYSTVDTLVKLGNRGSKFDAGLRLPLVDVVPEEVAATTLLARAAERQAASAQDSPTVQYSFDETGLRIREINLQALRGSPGLTKLSFTLRNSAVSTLIFGENGSGKSTIVDAVEFALQGRVGRSTNFYSPLSPALQSFATSTTPVATVSLSDGTAVTRSIALDPAGEPRANPSDVRPGFRLAPITLKRSDILNFLDTQALERGTILLDYFPGDAESIALRPEEEVRRLDAEATELRIRRSAVARELAPMLGVERSLVEQANSFRRVLRDRVMGGRTQKEFEEQEGWKSVAEDARNLIYRMQQIHSGLTKLKGRRGAIEEVLNPVVHSKQIANLRGIFDAVSEEVSSAFQAVANEHPVDRIDIVFGESGPLSLDLLVRLRDGSLCFPQQIFSEAYRDLVSLLFFTSVAKRASERGQAKVLILDDVLQSVDSKVRRSFVTYLLTEFADWQLIFTIHDRLWFDQLKDMFDAFEHPHLSLRIKSWTYDGGPAFSSPSADMLTRDLNSVVSFGEPRTVGLLAGQLLETVCSQLSWRLRLRVVRREDDRYTLGDLWPIVRERLSRTTAEGAVRAVASHRSLRNLVAHADPASGELTQEEARAFAHSVLELYSWCRCSTCGSWVRGEPTPKCNCGLLTLSDR